MCYYCVPGVEVGPGVEVLEGHALLGRVLVVLAHCGTYIYIYGRNHIFYVYILTLIYGFAINI